MFCMTSWCVVKLLGCSRNVSRRMGWWLHVSDLRRSRYKPSIAVSNDVIIHLNQESLIILGAPIQTMGFVQVFPQGIATFPHRAAASRRVDSGPNLATRHDTSRGGLGGQARQEGRPRRGMPRVLSRLGEELP